MELNSSKSNIILLTVIAIAAVMVAYSVLTFRQHETQGNIFECRGKTAPFRANISDCLKVPLYPSQKHISDIITSPAVNQVYILVEPNNTAELALSAFEIHKTLKALKIKSGVAYTEFWQNQSEVPVLSIENATYNYPIVWLRINESKTYIEAQGPKIIMSASSQYDLDAAACGIAIAVIKETYKC